MTDLGLNIRAENTSILSEYDSLPHPSQHQNMHYRYAVALNYGTGLASCRQKPHKLPISKRMPFAS